MEYVRVKFNPIQLRVIQDISKRLCGLIKISTLAMNGIIWHALRKWQTENNKSISEISNMHLRKRIITA